MSKRVLADRYRLTAELGQGGMGTVYRAHDELLDRPVAVKLLTDSNLGSEGRNNLLREAKLTAQLNHPNIVTVYDAGESEGAPFIVMELVEGTSLYQSPPESLETTLTLASQICAALEHAHQHKVIHRDLKPENILVGPEGTYKLMDFGLARSITSRLTSEGIIVGTVFYLAPEQAMGEDIDGRADLYSLGVMLYELTTGQLPFQADDPLAVISQHLHAPVVPPSAIRPDLPAALEAVILRLLAKDPQARFATAAEVQAELARLQAQTPAGPSALPPDARLEQLARGRLVGRQEQFQSLLELWRLAQAGQGQLAMLSGEPGVGKTRLANEMIVAARVHGAVILKGGCYEFEASSPYMPFVEALREWVHQSEAAELAAHLEGLAAGLTKLAPEVSTKLGEFEPLPALSPNEERLRLFDHVARLFRRLAATKAMLVVLDDLHWADTGTLQLLSYLVRHLGDHKVMVLGCYRELELDRAHPLAEALVAWNRERVVSRVSLDRLTMEETGHLLTTLFQDEITDEFRQAIHDETEGNPFFIEETVKALIAGGSVYRQEGKWQRAALEDLAIPQSVKEAIGRRLDRLDEDSLEVLHAASALGKSFAYTELAALFPDEDPLLDSLDQARQAQLLDIAGPESFVFTHDKIREVLYQELNPIRRRRLHQRIGESLESAMGGKPNGRVQDMAYHFVQSGDLARGMRYCLQAAEGALEVFALDAALQSLDAAEDCARSLGDEATLAVILVKKARTLTFQGRNRQAIEATQAALDLPQASGSRLETLVDLGSYLVVLSDERARPTLERALDEMDETTDPNLRSLALTLLGRDYHYRAQHGQAVALYEQALALVDPDEEPYAAISAHLYLAGGLQHQAEFDKSNQHANQAIDIGQRHGHLFGIAAGHEFLAENAATCGDWQPAIQHAAEDERIAREIGSLDRLAWAQFAMAWALHGRGDLATAAEQASSSLQLGQDLGELRLASFAGGRLGMIEADRGNFELAEPVAVQSLEWAEGFGQVVLLTNALTALALLELRRGEIAAAHRHLAQAEDHYGETENKTSFLLCEPLLAEVLVLLGRVDEAGVIVERATALTQRCGARSLQGQLHRVRGLILLANEQLEAAETSLNRALDLSTELGGRPEQARTHVALAQLRQNQDQPVQVRQELEQALAIMTECEMAPEAAEVRAQLAGLVKA